MKDFFRVMGKAFAIVFGSTSALALVIVLFVLALRPVLRSWSQRKEAPVASHDTDAQGTDEPGFTNIRPLPGAKAAGHGPWEKYQAQAVPKSFVPDLFLQDCNKTHCSVFDGNNNLVGMIELPTRWDKYGNPMTSPCYDEKGKRASCDGH